MTDFTAAQVAIFVRDDRIIGIEFSDGTFQKVGRLFTKASRARFRLAELRVAKRPLSFAGAKRIMTPDIGEQ